MDRPLLLEEGRGTAFMQIMQFSSGNKHWAQLAGRGPFLFGWLEWEEKGEENGGKDEIGLGNEKFKNLKYKSVG